MYIRPRDRSCDKLAVCVAATMHHAPRMTRQIVICSSSSQSDARPILSRCVCLHAAGSVPLSSDRRTIQPNSPLDGLTAFTQPSIVGEGRCHQSSVQDAPVRSPAVTAVRDPSFLRPSTVTTFVRRRSSPFFHPPPERACICIQSPNPPTARRQRCNCMYTWSRRRVFILCVSDDADDDAHMRTYDFEAITQDQAPTSPPSDVVAEAGKGAISTFRPTPRLNFRL